MSRDILAGLDLLDAAGAEALAARTQSFAPVHLGTRDVPVGTLLDLIRKDDALLPPRRRPRRRPAPRRGRRPRAPP
ncbi:hypothetical protein HCK01_19865, partial [Streptomyces sp. AA8]|uniref:DUF6025 family protein n=1 Tax=Streptomyces telluris TaxID=2720021 RepID=UPI0016A788FF